MKGTTHRRQRQRQGGSSQGARRRIRAASPRAHLHRGRASRASANELELITATCPGYNLGKAYKYVTREFEKEFRESNLTLAQFALLVNIGRREPASGSDVANRLGSDVSTVSRTIDLLVKRGLVLQQRGEDRRVRVYCLTNAGHAALSEAIPQWRRAKRATLAGLDRRAWSVTLRQIQKLGA
ncbi:MAG: MarR family winged helix-turn-helix transcriptional regulator [bacterium]